MRVEVETSQRTSPPWAAEFVRDYRNLAGGVRLDAAAFPLVDGKRYVASGTAVGKTYAETEYGPAAATDDQVYLVLFDLPDADKDADAELYRHGGLVRTNFLPGFGALVAGVQTKIRAAYECIIGADF